jgi:hypothetical protein
MDVNRQAPVRAEKSDSFKPMHASSNLDNERVDKKDYYDAPVLWIKKIFNCSRDNLIQKTEEAFRNANMVDVKVVELYTSSNRARDHAYLLLNSKRASELLLDGTINIIITVHKYKEDKEDRDDGEDKEDRDDKNDDGDNKKDDDSDDEMDITLWFDIADHLKPRDNQESCTIFIQGLPDNRPTVQIAQELRRKISKWCPIEDIDVPSDKTGKGLSVGTAKIKLQHEFDTQKCIYLLNYSLFLEREIRVSFCNINRVYTKRNYSAERDTRRKDYDNTPKNNYDNAPKNNYGKPPTRNTQESRNTRDNSPPKHNSSDEEETKPVKQNNRGWTDVKKK